MEDLRTSETWRVFRIQSELIDGIETLHNLGAAVSVFGMRITCTPAFTTASTSLRP